MTTNSNELNQSNELLKIVLESLDDDKAIDVVSIPLNGKSSIADFMVIASGTSSRRLMAMAEHLQKNLKKTGNKTLGAEGKQAADWILIDAGDVIIHLFRPEVRQFYQLEKMWNDPQNNPQKHDVVTINSA